MLHIVCYNQVWTVNAEQARSLELKLNVTSKGHEWKEIGDCLFAFHSSNVASENLSVTPEQYALLKRISELASDQCRKL